MCCGRPRRTTPFSASPPRSDGVLFEYVGRTALTVAGPGSGATYRFVAPGGRLKIDPRDQGAFAKVPVLRQVR
ncbi:MAG TPA: hypothetical protein VGF71_16115 [Caulobacteraceae bacterium]|jgi:hypothetical protein